MSEQEDNMEENSDYSPSDEADSEGEEQAARETFMSKNNTISWSSLPYQVAGRMAAENVIRMTPGPTTLATSHASDILSTFQLFLPQAIETIVIEMTNKMVKNGRSWM